MSMIKKATLATALAATTLAAASPAMAQDYYRHNRGGDTTGAAIAGGVIGLALGAIIGSSVANNNRGDYRYRYADRGWQYRNGYYWDQQGRRYDRTGNYDRRYYDRRGYDDRGWGQTDRGYYGRDEYYGQRNYRNGY